MLERLRQDYRIRVTLVQSRPGRVFPQVDTLRCSIQFNPKLRGFAVLYALMLRYPAEGYEAVSQYTLYNLYLDADSYSEASTALDRLEQEITRLEHTLPSSTLNGLECTVDTQQLFILLHEAAHIVLTHCPDERAWYDRQARRRVEEMRVNTDGLADRMRAYLEDLLPDSLPADIRHCFSEEQHRYLSGHADRLFDVDHLLQADDSWLEELSCDQLAWSYALSAIGEACPSENALLQANTDILLSLYVMDYDKALNASFDGTAGTKLSSLPLRAGIRHGSLRESIWLYYKMLAPSDRSHAFMDLHQSRDEAAKRLLMRSLLEHVPDMHQLRHSQDRPVRPSAIMALEGRFVAIEQRICDFLSQ